MLASQFDVDALIFTSTAAPEAPGMLPSGHASENVNAAANRFRYKIVAAGDSTVTMAALSPEHWIPVTLGVCPAIAVFVTVTPALVPTPVAVQRPWSLSK
jgi:hypothetical protein